MNPITADGPGTKFREMTDDELLEILGRVIAKSDKTFLKAAVEVLLRKVERIEELEERVAALEKKYG